MIVISTLGPWCWIGLCVLGIILFCGILVIPALMNSSRISQGQEQYESHKR